MRVILEHTGRLAIDIIPGTDGPHQSRRPSVGAVGHQRPSMGEAGDRAHSAESQPGELGKRGDFSSFATVEEELFSVLMFLLRRIRLQTGQIPSHAVLDSVVRAFDILLTVGKLPPATQWDRSLLTVLLVALEQTATRHGCDWLDELITHVRESLRTLNSPSDDSEDDNGSGSGGADDGTPGSGDPAEGNPEGHAPKNNKPKGGAPSAGHATGSGPSDGRVANEWRGSPTRRRRPSDDSTLDTATTRPVKKKGE